METFVDNLVKAMPKVRGYAQKLTRCPDKADDLLQDVMLRAIDKQHQFMPGTNLPAWLCTICHNIHAQAYRRGKRMVSDLPEEVFSMIPSKTDIQSALEAKDALSHIILLPDAQQTALMLCASGMTLEEIAAAEGVPDGTIKSRIHRARSSLAALIQDPDLRPMPA